MTTAETTSYRIEDATSSLWFGRWPSGWGDVVHGVDRGEARSAAGMIDVAGLAWTVLALHHPSHPSDEPSLS